MNSFNPNYFIHAGNVLLLVAYSVRDILWLRLFAVAAALISIPYFVLQPTMLWAAQLDCRVCGDQSGAIMASVHRASSSQTDTGGGGHSTARFPGLTFSQSPPGSEHWIL